MTSTEIRKKIDKLRTLTTRDARFRPATWLPLWEIAYQLAVLNELVPSVLPPGFFAPSQRRRQQKRTTITRKAWDHEPTTALPPIPAPG